MSEATTTASLRSLIKFPFRGPDWQRRLIIGAGLVLIPLLIPIPLIRWLPSILLSGYILKVMRQAIKGEELTLPAWEDWGELTLDGLRVTLVNLVYLLPGMLVMFGGMAVYFLFSIAAPLQAAVAEETGGMPGTFLVMLFGSMAVMMLSMFLGWLLFILGAIPLPVALGHFAAKGELAAAFRVREWWALLRVNKLGYFIAWVVILGLFTVLYLVFVLAYSSVILCCLIPFLMAPVGFYLSLVYAALFGQTYRDSVAMAAASEAQG